MRGRSTSRRSRGAALAAAGALIALALAVPGGADARRVRVFAMQPKLDVAWLESRRTFQEKMFALADRRLRGPGRPAVQRGAGDFASHLRPDGRNLVLWPEDMGLFAALTGQRAAPARSSGSLEGAIATLVGLYPQQNSYYAAKYPAVASRPIPVRLLTLALTDTFAHVAVETYSRMARRYGVWLEAGIDMAQGWKVVCDDRQAFNAARPPRLPTGERCREENAAKVDQLGDPFDPGRDFAYEATTPRTRNMALVFDPRGRVVSRQLKEYLTPIELPGQLDLVPGAIDSGLSALRTPVGTLGFVTSKDAWMPDVQARLDEAHVDLLVQPELFLGDTATDSNRMWAPDTMLASGYSNVLKLPSVEAMAEPDLVGNIFNYSADQQSHLALKPRRRGAAARHLIGQPDHPGLVDAMPWVVRDPLGRNETFPHRRERLAAAGRKLLPGSGVRCPDPRRPAPCENGQVEGVLWRDVTVHRRPPRRAYHGARAKTAPFGRSRAVHPSANAQRNASIAMRGDRGAIAFEERRAGHDQVVLARTSDGGRTWSRAVHATGRRAGLADEQWPAVAIGPKGRVTVAWNDDSTGVQRVYYARTAGR
ncbi:MAG TPA: hypothetical protein VJT75_12140, partial [Thermoleophilaceae bacterium]|nr:hypothetical protein [Thermoleophilaceae bacterium]